jgi:hypothetical protein
VTCNTVPVYPLYRIPVVTRKQEHARLDGLGNWTHTTPQFAHAVGNTKVFVYRFFSGRCPGPHILLFRRAVQILGNPNKTLSGRTKLCPAGQNFVWPDKTLCGLCGQDEFSRNMPQLASTSRQLRRSSIEIIDTTINHNETSESVH